MPCRVDGPEHRLSLRSPLALPPDPQHDHHSSPNLENAVKLTRGALKTNPCPGRKPNRFKVEADGRNPPPSVSLPR